MGVQISDIVPRKEISLKDLKGKVIAIDAFNTIYQFLSTIRQPDGTPLMDSNGKITSHLSGLFYRNINLLLEGIKPIYVFDGIPPELKQAEQKRRKELKKAAQEKYESAREKGDKEQMGKYARQTVRITDEIIEESKELLQAMGIPVIQAHGEGEAEAAVLAKTKKVWAAASQDYDALLFGSPLLIRNLTLSRKRKTSAGIYININLELIDFQDVLNKLQIDKDQLICIGILIGTDFNPGGIKGIGQKIALDIVQRYKYPIKIFEYIEKNPKYNLDFDWQEIFKIFHENPPTIHEDKINFKELDEEKVKTLLLKKDFSENRIDSGLKRLKQVEEVKKQKALGDFI